MNILDEVIIELKKIKELDRKVYKYWPHNFTSLPVCSVSIISAPDTVWADCKGQKLLDIHIQVNIWEKMNSKIKGLEYKIMDAIYLLPYPAFMDLCMVDISDSNEEVRTIQEFVIKGGEL